MDGLMVLILALVMIPAFLMVMLTPYITRKTESFGVSIPEALYDDHRLKKMRRAYLVRTGILAIPIFLMITFLIVGLLGEYNEQFIGVLFTVFIFIYIVGSFLIYFSFHRKMKQMKKDENWKANRKQQVVIDTAFHQKKKIHSNGWLVIPALLIGVTLIITFFQYDRIPERIPMQFSFSGEVTKWADKSLKSVLLLPAMQFFLLVLFGLVNTVIGRSKQQINAENPERSAEQNRLFRRRFSAFMMVSATLMVMLFGLIQLSFIYSLDNTMIGYGTIGLSGIIIIGAIILSLKTGQGGSRIKVNVEDKDGNMIDRDDDRYWKLGQIYVNRNDPAMFLEKRFGVGWTVNVAHPLVWILFLGLIAISVGLPLWLGT
ncbi:MAG TPA: DUF5808 domain-containing protein [Bacillota bacterium]|nr:DUF5808 domain-containing protein [Bacillota bacterium]